MKCQENKVFNLRLAAEPINSILIRPGEMFSFWQLVRYTEKEGFDTSGLNVVYNGTNINDKITFWTSGTVELTQGRPFQTTGTKEIKLHYDGKSVGSYTITVTK